MRFVPMVMLVAAIQAAQAQPAASVGSFPVYAFPEAVRLIRTATEVYVIPVVCIEKRHRAKVSGWYTTLTPRGDYKHARLLGSDARRQLCRVLGKESNWFHGADDTFGIGSEPKNVGYIFRSGKDKLVLLGYMRWRFEGTINGAPTHGSLEETASDKLDEWKRKYAQPELAMKKT